MPLERYKGCLPEVHPTAWIHDTAVLVGEVQIGPRVSIWPHCVLRGDQGAIYVDEESNLQDGTIVHCTGGLSETRVGARVTVGHRVLLHGCIVESDSLIGMGAILLDNCVVSTGCIVGAAALVSARKHIPPRSMVLGVPGRIVRQVTDAELIDVIGHGCQEYLRLAQHYGGRA